MKIAIHENTNSKIFVLDPLAPTEKAGREGEYFISFPKQLANKIPGSSVGPAAFLKQNNQRQGISKILLSDKVSKKYPLATFKSRTTTISIYHGSTNPICLKMIGLAKNGFENTNIRATYQKNILKIISPIISTKSDNLDYHIVEDCLASGDTLIGIIGLLKRTDHLKNIRIDVVVATTIGTSLLIEAAAKMNVNLTLNIGYLAFGLSKGEKVKKARIHANYITLPNEFQKHLPPDKIGEYLSDDGNMYIVGDMGDAAKSMPNDFDTKYPWNKLREDAHGQHSKPQIKHAHKSSVKDTHCKMMYFTNGGYLMRSFVKYLTPENTLVEKIISAKRIWSTDPKYGYGVLVDNFR